MNRKIVAASLMVIFALFASASANGTEFDRSRVIVQLRPLASGQSVITKSASGRADFDRLMSALRVNRVDQVLSPARTPAKGREHAQRLRLHDFAIVTVPIPSDPDQFLATLRKSPDVERADFDVIVRAVGSNVAPNDPYFATQQYGLRNTGTQPSYDQGTADADIDMDAGWDFTTGDSSVVLAILDTGLDLVHPEFEDRIWLNPGEEFDDVDNDSNGFVDDGFGWNFDAESNGNSDDNGHGTHATGIAAATGNNGVGIAGVNWQCKIMAVKVLGGDGSGSTASVANGIVYAANEGADLISMSLGHLGTSVAVESVAVAYAQALGVIVVAAMGNDDVGTTHWPAAYDGVISVGATDSDDQRADPFCYSPVSGSNYGSWIEVCAPGDNVWSTYVTGFGSYTNLCGTSMATPHVAGLVSLMLTLRPNWPLDSVVHILKNTSDDQVGRVFEDTPGFDIYHGWGRINAGRALRPLAVEFVPALSAPDSVDATEAVPMSFGLTAIDSNLSTLSFSVTPLANAMLTDHGDGTATFDFTPDYSQAGEYTLECVVTDGVFADTSSVVVTVANGCQCPCHADPGCNGVADIIDVVNTIAVAFRSGDAMIDPDCFPNPGGRTDVNCSGSTDIIDVVAMVNVAFRAQAPNFCDPCSL